MARASNRIAHAQHDPEGTSLDHVLLPELPRTSRYGLHELYEQLADRDGGTSVKLVNDVFPCTVVRDPQPSVRQTLLNSIETNDPLAGGSARRWLSGTRAYGVGTYRSTCLSVVRTRTGVLCAFSVASRSLRRHDGIVRYRCKAEAAYVLPGFRQRGVETLLAVSMADEFAALLRELERLALIDADLRRALEVGPVHTTVHVAWATGLKRLAARIGCASDMKRALRSRQWVDTFQLAFQREPPSLTRIG